LELSGLWAYQELFYITSREVKIRYKQTIMGASWAILQLLSPMIIFSLLFGRLARMPSNGIPYPLFSYSGLILWIFFSGVLSDALISLVSNAHMLSKVNFPRIFFPAVPKFPDYWIISSL